MSTRKKSKKRKDPLAGLDKVTADLYRAVENYVKAHEGSLIVIGGIEVQHWPGDDGYKFKVAVKCLGRAPSYSA